MARRLATIYAVVALTLACVLALLVGVTLILPFAVVPRLERPRYTRFASHVWGHLVRLLLLVRLRVERQSPPPAWGPRLYVCNHRSWLDPPLLQLATGAVALSKREVLKIPMIGWFGVLAGTVYFDRGSSADRQRARREVLELLQAGHSVFVFPEGTRSRSGELAARPSLVLVRDCHQHGIPVVPCAVLGSERTLPTGRIEAWPLQRVALSIGAELDPSAHPDADSFAEAAWSAVRAQLATLDRE